MDVSIVIPTKNGGSLLNEVLRNIFKQKTKYLYEVICVDSGSKDETIQIIKNFDIKLYQIEPEDFGHGKTRNFGASKGSGEFIIFITQDAVPASECWMENLVNAMKLDDDIAGGFGIHYPYPDCNIIDKRDITMHFRGFGEDNTIFFLEDNERYKIDEGYRHLLGFFSDNNSCLRRSVWEKYPYEDVNFSEDQIWARKIIELGYKKVYCPFAPVFHSHNYKISSYFGRYFDEHKALYVIHQYINIKKWYFVLPAAFRHIYIDSKYVKNMKIGKKRKLKELNYIIWRNLSRYVAGYLGGHYAFYPNWYKKFLDRHISQQYKQKRA
ncbi:MAG: glycosyltransferase family 2 protein [Lachnospiraceae bacterium]|jgi:rhamnosyltransferase|nr:glycosyltransferase family 2 protein [Lachnospiraceae bacterium]